MLVVEMRNMGHGSLYRGMLKTWMLWADALLGRGILHRYPGSNNILLANPIRSTELSTMWFISKIIN
jgi:hypothetical protein